MSDLNTEIKIGADASGVEAGVGRAKRSLASLGDSAKQAGKDAGAGMASVGAGGDKAAKDVERATKNIQGQLQRAIASFEAGERGSRKFYESIARQRGANVNTLKPLLDQLDAYKSKAEAAAKASEKAGSSFSDIGASAALAGRALAAIGITASVGEFIRMADASTNVASRLRLVTASAGELASVQERLFQVAQNSRVSFTDLVGTYAQVARSTKDLGVSQTALLGVIETISQAVTISGGSAASAQAALTQLSQGFASGALRGEELNSILEQTPRLAQALADGLGVGVGKLRELGQAGELTSEKVLGALEKSAASVAAEFSKMSVTVEQASTNAANSVLKLVGAFDKLTGVTSVLGGALQSISSGLDFISRDLEKLGSQGPLRSASLEVITLNNAAERLRNGMANGVLGPNAQSELDRINIRLAEAKRRFRELDQQISGIKDPRDQSGFTGRGESYAKEAARQAKLRDDANTFRLNQAGVPQSYVKDMQELIRLNQAGVIVGKEYTDALAKQQALLNKKTGAVKSSADSVKAEQTAYENLITSIKTKLALDKAELDGAAALTESQQMRIKLDADLAGGRLKLTAAHEQEIRAAMDALGVSEALMKARKQEQEQATAAADAYASALESRQAAAASLAEQISQERESIAAMGLSKTAVAELEAAKLSETATTKLRLAAIADEIDWTGKLGNAYREEAAQLEQLAKLKREGAAKQASIDAAEAAADEWQKTSDKIEDALTDALMRGFENGKSFGENLGDTISNYFKTTVAKEIAAAITRAIMSALASTQWGQFISGAMGGGGGGNMGSSLLSSAAQNYMGGGSAWGASANAVGSWATGSMSTANMAGSVYANYTGAGIDGLLATNGAYGTAASGSTAAGASSASWISALGYVALIAAAVVVAENLYSKGYNRAALGDGPGETKRFGYTQFTSDPNMGNAWQYKASPSMEYYNRELMEWSGMSEKWADIFSGTVRMAATFGRKLGAYGYEAKIADGDAEVGGFARYKGGLLRSNKTVAIDVDQRDAAAVDAIVESTIEGARGMARAMGYSSEAIDAYTGSIKVNMKGAETAEEQSKRMAEAMDELQMSLLKAASGGKYSREEFEKMMEGVRQSIEAAGISTQGIADILVAGMTGRLSQADVGDQLADMIVGGIYNSIASNYAGVIAQAFTTQIITPIFTALAAGVPISQAISQAAIQNVVATAQSAAQALNAIFNDAGFRQAIGGIQQAISGVAGAVTSVKVPKFGSAARSAGNQSAQERYQLETRLLTLLGNTNRLRQRELAGLSAGNRALQLRIWALEDAKSAVEAAMSTLERSIEAQRETVQKQLDSALESESALKDVFDTLRENIRDLRGDVSSTAGIGAAEGRDKIRQAISGAITLSNEDLTDAIDAVRESLDAQAFASKFERDRAMLGFASELDSLAGVTEESLSAAEQTVTLLEEQLESLDSTLELAQKQVDALFGVDTSVKTVANAVLALNVAMSGYASAVAAAQAVATSGGGSPSGGGSSGGGGSSTPRASTQWTADGYWAKNLDLQKEYANLIKIDPKQTDPRFTKDANMSYRDEYLAWHWNTIGKTERRKFAKGGYYPGGLALVGEEGPEIINFKQPGQVYTARQTAELMRGESGMADVVKEIRDLRSEQRAQASAMVGMQQRLNKIVSRWDAAGIPEERVLA